ncbi:E3 ubiquitin-protein ligase RNF180 [Brachyhypopomus gauderio]|uniref:E3 ubiquitin-protein ligase RNF180 n=1 Tax=Brachyhypopomus gauderio TaxID=698409 RepID=UPI004041F6CB
MARCDTDRVSDFLGIAEEPSILRCRKCRRCVADSTCLLSVSKEITTTCNVWHVDVDKLPDWILIVVDKVHWTVGKLSCQHCGARLGGFNFLSCPKCPCGHDTTVHFSKSRVDEGIKHFVNLSRPRRAVPHAERQECQEGCLGQQKKVEESEVRGDFQSNQNQSHDLYLVTQPLNSEIDLQTMQIQAVYLGGGPSAMSPCSVSSLHSTSPTDENINASVAVLESGQDLQNQRSVDADSEGHRYVEPLGYLDDPERSVTFSPPLGTSTLDREAPQEQEDVGPEVTEEILSHDTFRTVQLTKKEKNRLKSLRKKQRKKEHWLQRQLDGKSAESGDDDDDEEEEEKEGFTCAVCLDVYYNPYMCQPCTHVFCEPCLRTLARNRPHCTPCPLCRTPITHVLFQTELHQSTRSTFQKEYRSRKESFQRNNYSKWPLPNCPKRFRLLWGFHRPGASRWRFPHRALGLDGLDGLDLGEMQGWPLDPDVLIIFIYSFHWVLALIIICGLCYYFLL